MKSVFEKNTIEELKERINSLSNNNSALWGKMNVYQMVKHCTQCDRMYHGDIVIKRVFIGRLIGKNMLKKTLKDDSPFGKNSPTSPILKTTNDAGDLEQQKKEWFKMLDKYTNFSNHNFIHPFFGPMTTEQIGVFVYKHADHHLRQFGA